MRDYYANLRISSSFVFQRSCTCHSMHVLIRTKKPDKRLQKMSDLRNIVPNCALLPGKQKPKNYSIALFNRTEQVCRSSLLGPVMIVNSPGSTIYFMSLV